MTGRRVIVHAGFHKTGTTSAQQFLRANGKLIYPRCALVLPGKLRGQAARMAVRYARFGKAHLLDSFASDLHDTLSQIDAGSKRAVLISDENLAGRMPGREGQKDYAATPALMARAEAVILDIFGPDTQVFFHFNIRAAEGWLHSTYKHNLRQSRLTLDADAYAAKFAAAADLAGVAQQVRYAVRGTVSTADLATLTGPEGTAAPLLDLIGIPDRLRVQMQPQEVLNKGPADELAPELLALNKSGLSDHALAAAKKALLDDRAAQQNV